MCPNITKILLFGKRVEDLRTLRDRLFDGDHHNVLCALNAKDAEEIARKEEPELIILEWEKEEKNSLDILKSLRNHPLTQLIPILISLESSVDLGDSHNMFDNLAIDYIRKPYETIELHTRVNSALKYSSAINVLAVQKLEDIKRISLLEEEARKQASLIVASDVACLFIKNGVVIEANSLFYDFTGFSEKEVLHHPFYNFLPKNIRNSFRETEDLIGTHFSVSLLTISGETLPVQMLLKEADYRNEKVEVVTFVKLEHFSKVFAEKHISSFLERDNNQKLLNQQIESLSIENRDLLNQLQFKTLQSAHVYDFLLVLSRSLKDTVQLIPEENLSCRENMIHHIGQLNHYYRNNGFWKEFKLRFSDLHTGFYDKLVMQNPSLTETDLRLCAFIKLKMSTAEISRVLNQSANSVKVARNRLRRKLQIDNVSVSLLNYLASY